MKNDAVRAFACRFTSLFRSPRKSRKLNYVLQQSLKQIRFNLATAWHLAIGNQTMEIWDHVWNHLGFGLPVIPNGILRSPGYSYRLPPNMNFLKKYFFITRALYRLTEHAGSNLRIWNPFFDLRATPHKPP